MLYPKVFEFVEKSMGIRLTGKPDTYRRAVHRISSKLETLGMTEEAYVAHLTLNEDAAIELYDATAITTTSWLRDTDLWVLYRKHVLANKEQRPLRVWSIGCSTGQEPYAAAIFAIECGKTVSVSATDYSQRNIDKAVAGVYPLNQINFRPAVTRKHFIVTGQTAKVKELPVVFYQSNILDYRCLSGRMYDFIFMRNVLMHFDKPVARIVLGNVLQSLLPTGYLYTGKTEEKSFDLPILKQVAPMAFQLKGE